ncbi:MAG: DUF3611 family protein [Elainellaceae cyanobacterium]
MTNKLASYLSPPSRREFAETFRVAGRVSFWLQIVLGAVSGVALLFAIFSRSFSDESGNAGIGFSIFLAIVGILIICFRIYWAFRYRRLAKRLQAPNSVVRPRKEDIIQVLRIGTVASLVGLLIAFLGSELSVIVVLAEALAQPQGVAVYNPENVIRSLYILVILSNVNLIGAHFVGSINSLWLLNWVDQ